MKQAASDDIAELRTALRAVLLFYSPTWDHDKMIEWERITGTSVATTRVLCDHIRKVLGDWV